MDHTQWLSQGQLYVIEFSSLVAAITVIVGAVLALYNFWKKKSGKSHEALKSDISEHEKRLTHHDACLDRDQDNIRELYTEMKDLKHVNRLLVRGMMQLITHNIDGNHVDQLEKVRDDMNEYLVSK